MGEHIETQTTVTSPEEAFPEAAAILRAAGWKPHDPWGVYTRGTVVMGFSPDGQHFDVKNWGADVHGPDYPDDPVEAAQWLVNLRAPNPLQTEVTLEPVSLAPEPEPAELGGEGEPTAEYGDGSTDDGPGVERDANPIDADFTAEDLGSDDLLADGDFAPLALEGADAEPEAPAQDGPIAYGASTIDGLIREKLGRVSQIARELKAVQQEGWTLEEYAYLQNLMVRMDRGEAPDDQASRERFLAIAMKSQAMSRIDAVRDRKEGELEEIGQRRDFDAAVYYEPGEGWPA